LEADICATINRKLLIKIIKMKKETITKLFAAVVITVASAASGFAQTNLGAACGCPEVNQRGTILLSTLAVNGGATDGSLTANTTILDCSKTWILDKKIYVDAGKTLIIQPGTVIKGRYYAGADSATALIVSRGAKIIAAGTADCGIVFTAEADTLDGSYSIRNTGKWGGLVIAGRASNNLTLAANGPYTAGSGNGRLCVADGIGVFEGFASNDSRFQFGATPGSFDDNDNSGILKYVSVRHAGTVLTVGAEINGISFGSVGRGTVVENIEIVSCGDDNMEFFGGTVNVKHASFMFGNDDGFDYDDGYSGKVQFVFSVKGAPNDTLLTAKDADNGFECDADDQKSNLLPRSHPYIYNCTFIGNGKQTLTSDNSGIAGIEAKELTEGEFYNNIFANYRYGFNVVKSLPAPPTTRTEEAYANWSNASPGSNPGSLKVKCNIFVGCQKNIAIDKNAITAATAADTAQFYTTDKNIGMSSIPGFNYVWAMNGLNNTVGGQFDPNPTPGIVVAGCPTAPADGFFTPAAYAGAFDPNGPTWLSGWSYAQVLQVMGGLAPCPTDINQDGVTDNADFLILLSQFNLNCQ
jgi:hypothetical protein